MLPNAADLFCDLEKKKAFLFVSPQIPSLFCLLTRWVLHGGFCLIPFVCGRLCVAQSKPIESDVVWIVLVTWTEQWRGLSDLLPCLLWHRTILWCCKSWWCEQRDQTLPWDAAAVPGCWRSNAEIQKNFPLMAWTRGTIKQLEGRFVQFQLQRPRRYFYWKKSTSTVPCKVAGAALRHELQ